MAVAIDEVLKWLDLDDAGHVLAYKAPTGGHYALCGRFTPDGKVVRTAPDLICSECNRALKLTDTVPGKQPKTERVALGPTTPQNPRNSKLMLWIRDHLDYQGEDCLIWPFGKGKDGYGMIGRGGKCTNASRYICEAVKGPPPSDKHQAAHSCERGHDGCVNPRHLSWKTPQENQLDRSDFSRKLTPEQVDEIKLVAGAERQSETAERFGVRESTIWQIQTGRLHPDRTQRLTQPRSQPEAK